jgi:hypothetical protein
LPVMFEAIASDIAMKNAIPGKLSEVAPVGIG